MIARLQGRAKRTRRLKPSKWTRRTRRTLAIIILLAVLFFILFLQLRFVLWEATGSAALIPQLELAVASATVIAQQVFAIPKPPSSANHVKNMTSPSPSSIFVSATCPVRVPLREPLVNVSIDTLQGRTLYLKVHDGSDIVSNQISRTGKWEYNELAHVLDLLGTNGLFLDIGANIGWFTLNAAAAGHNVIAFEPFLPNAHLVHASMCANEGMERKIRLFAMGLGQNPADCEFWQNPAVNFGDTVPICPDTPEDRKALWKSRGFVKLGDAPVTTLDTALEHGLFPRRIDVMKIDVEGNEPNILAGGEKFFTSEVAPNQIIMEVMENLLEDALGHGAEHLQNEFKLLLRYGYKTGGMDTMDKITLRMTRQFQGNPEFERITSSGSLVNPTPHPPAAPAPAPAHAALAPAASVAAALPPAIGESERTAGMEDDAGRRLALETFISHVGHTPTEGEVIIVATRGGSL